MITVKPSVSGLEWICLVFMLIAGIILAFLTPIYQIPDAQDHFARAWQVSEGIFISPTKARENGKSDLIAEIPSVYMQEKYTMYASHQAESEGKYSSKDIKDFLEAPLNNNDRLTRTINNSGSYSPIVYFPQAIAAYVTRSLGFTAGGIYYAMRIAGLLFAVFCAFLSIRLLPEKGLLIFLLALMPMYLTESASISADSALYGICILVSAYILSLTRDDNILTGKQICILLFMSVIIGLAKQVYGTIMLLYFLIPSKRLGSTKRYAVFGIILLGVCLLSSLTWVYFSTTRYNAAMVINDSADIAKQLENVYASPLNTLSIILKSNIHELGSLLITFVGVLGWLNVKAPLWFYFVYAFIINAGALHGKLRISVFHRVIMIFGFLATLFALDFYIYLTWLPVNAQIITGVQGRYFIPLALMALSAFSFLPVMKHEKLLAVFAGSLSTITTLVITYTYFYR